MNNALGTFACRQYVDIKKNNSNNLYNNKQCQDIASSRPMQTKGCCKGNNYEQRFALETFPADLSWRSCSISWHPFSPWHNPSSVLLMAYRKRCILLFTLQQDCNTRKACRLFIVVKVVQVVFHYKQELLSPRSVVTCCKGCSSCFPFSAGRFSTPITFHRTLSHGFARQRILSHNGGGEKL